MIFLKNTYLVEGRNRNILLSRLKKHGVRVLNVVILSEKLTEITIDSKDSEKFFAICKNLWYNKSVKISGIVAPFYTAGRNLAVTAFVVIFFLLCFLFGNTFAGEIYEGDSLFFKAEIAEALENSHIKRLSYFDQKDLDKVKIALEKDPKISFARVEKWGNKAIIDIKKQKTPPAMLKRRTGDIVARENLKILNISVYSGTPFFKKGDSVKKGETIVGGYYIEEEKVIPCDIIAEISVECTFLYDYKSKFGLKDEDIGLALSIAEFSLGDCEILSAETKKLDKNTLRITIKYEKEI